MLVRPEILMVMANASKDPNKYAQEEEEKKKAMSKKTD